jgi:hypothetical protein
MMIECRMMRKGGMMFRMLCRQWETLGRWSLHLPLSPAASLQCRRSAYLLYTATSDQAAELCP